MSIDCQIYGQPTTFMVLRFPTMPRKRHRRITSASLTSGQGVESRKCHLLLDTKFGHPNQNARSIAFFVCDYPKLVLAQAINMVIPVHCNESVNVARMADALAWRAKVVGMGHAFLVDRYLRTLAWLISFQQK